MGSYTAFGTVALVAFCLKVMILAASFTRSRVNAVVNLICLMFILQNALEFITAVAMDNQFASTRLLLDSYMITLYLSFLAMVYFSVSVIGSSASRAIMTFFGAFTALLVALHLSGLLVSGYREIGYSVISSPGQYYWLFQLFILLAIGTSLYLPGSNLHSSDPEIADRSHTILLALAPLCLIAAAVLLLRLLGINASSAIVLPIGTTVFMWVLIKQDKGEFVAFKIKWRIIFKLATTMRNLSLSEWGEEVERQLVREALRMTNNNQSAAAKLVGCNTTTFHRRATKYTSEEKPEAKSGRLEDSVLS